SGLRDEALTVAHGPAVEAERLVGVDEALVGGLVCRFPLRTVGVRLIGGVVSLKDDGAEDSTPVGPAGVVERPDRAVPGVVDQIMREHTGAHLCSAVAPKRSGVRLADGVGHAREGFERGHADVVGVYGVALPAADSPVV